MSLPAAPDYTGGSLVNLVAELEFRLAGSADSPRLHEPLRSQIPDGAGYVLVVFDGLGTGQLEHAAAATLRSSLAGSIDAPFPTTTTVSLASIAAGAPPASHGLLGYQLWMPELGHVANTIKWTTLWGEPLDYETIDFLPEPNLWERLSAAGIEPITVQPEGFRTSKLSRLLYRGCRFEGVSSTAEMIDATVQLATPGRLVVTYVANVDFAAHVYGQAAAEYDAAMSVADAVWSRLSGRLRPDTALIGTADHGHVDFPRERQIEIPRPLHEGRIFYGDGRVMFVKGEGASLADELPATWVGRGDMEHWWGSGTLRGDHRAPDGVLMADDDHLLLHKHSDDRMIGNHGGLTDAERVVPLLVRT